MNVMQILLLILVAFICPSKPNACVQDAFTCAPPNGYRIPCGALGTPLGRLCCIASSCSNNDSLAYIWPEMLGNMSTPLPQYQDKCPSHHLSCCPQTLEVVDGTPYVDSAVLDGDNFRLCSRAPGDKPKALTVHFTGEGARLEYTPQNCSELTGCSFLQLQPEYPSTIGRNWVFAEIVIQLSKGAAFVFPSSIITDDHVPIIHFSSNELIGGSNITAVALMVREGYVTWDMDIGCLGCGTITFDIQLWDPPTLTSQTPTIWHALPAFAIMMNDWKAEAMRLTISCSAPIGEWARYPQLLQYSHPPGCSQDQNLQQDLSVDSNGRLIVSWDAKNCEVFQYVKVPGFDCTRKKCLGDVPSECWVHAAPKELPSVVAEALIGVLLLVFITLPLFGLCIPALHPTPTAAALPPNVWPLEGDGTHKHQAQLLLRPETEELPPGQRLMSMMDIVMLLALCAYFLVWVIFPMQRGPEVAVVWLPVILMVGGEGISRLQGRTFFGGRALWRYVLLGLLLGALFAHASRFQWQMLNSLDLGTSSLPSVDFDAVGPAWHTSAPSAVKLVASHSVASAVMEIVVRALVIAVGETLARIHVVQYSTLGNMGLGKSVYEVVMFSVLSSAAFGAAHLNVIDLVHALLLETVPNEPCPDPSMCSPTQSRWSGGAMFVIVRLAGVLMFIPTGLIIGLTVATMGRQIRTYHRQMLFLVLTCVAPDTCLAAMRELYVHSTGYIILLLLAPVAVFLLCLGALTAGIAWRHTFRPILIVPTPQVTSRTRAMPVMEVPRQMLCPLTGCIMEEPTIILICGHYFERDALMRELSTTQRCPLCNTPCQVGDTMISREMKRFITQWLRAMAPLEVYEERHNVRSHQPWFVLPSSAGDSPRHHMVHHPILSPPCVALGIPIPAETIDVEMVTGQPQGMGPHTGHASHILHPPQSQPLPPIPPEPGPEPAPEPASEPAPEPGHEPGPEPPSTANGQEIQPDGPSDPLPQDDAPPEAAQLPLNSVASQLPELEAQPVSPVSLPRTGSDRQFINSQEDTVASEEMMAMLGQGLEGSTHPRYWTLITGAIIILLLLFFWICYSPTLLFMNKDENGMVWGQLERLEMCGAITLGIAVSASLAKVICHLCHRRGSRVIHFTWLVMYFLTAVITSLPFLLWAADLASISTALLVGNAAHTPILVGRLLSIAVLLVIEEAWKAYFGNLALKVYTATPESVILFVVAVAAGWSTAQQTVLTLFIYYALDMALAAQMHLYITIFTPIALLAQHLVSGALIGMRLGYLRKLTAIREPDSPMKFRWPIWIPVFLRILWVIGSVLSYTHTVIIGWVAFGVWLMICVWAIRRHWLLLWSLPPNPAPPASLPPSPPSIPE